ncbi:rhomboid-domain-containing protein [Aspergillus steynii IBT 23096]|uniref:Rhomboid-domain-containing protein n=1 Tax=Aspergillus steynii IBT 23096 TaxID=1392250 RepID=A0A2I2FTR4_9EURO|nr:rhomboid-domain-containing protein [Aspergillus steynii IBT 23096]PLB44038.1 rhomboid-domain-containing protein [Aspergillus steynii IBT 23096]
MSNAFCVAWRVPCSGLRSSSLLPSNPTSLRLFGCISPSPAVPVNVARRPASTLRPLPGITHPTSPRGSIRSPFPFSFARSFANSGSRYAQSGPPVENGIQPRAKPFSQAEINAIFGPSARVSHSMGNRVLAVLHGRRLNGTPELDLPRDIILAVRGPSRDKALEWLREHYPLDEDAAILARFEREEREAEERLIRRAENLGLYKPQSGSFGAELGESNDPSGRSILQETRQRNEARILAEEEKRRQEWLEGEAQDREKMQRMVERNTALQKYEESSALEARPRADPSQRPFLAWIQKHHLQATDWDIDISHVTTRSRLLPGLVFTVIALGLCYVFAQNYEPPAKADRIWPTVPPAAATALAIVGANFGIFALWKVCPPAWRMLNRYFITVAAYPRTASLVGNVFSHQSFLHLAGNMFVVWWVGTQLHDEIGRGNFLAIYLASGIFGSFASLTVNVLRGRLAVTSLGASSAISGCLGSWCTLHADDKFTFFFVPKEWQETCSIQGKVFLTGLVLLELVNLRFSAIGGQIDNWAHLGGLLIGTLSALAHKRQEKERLENTSWFDRMFRGESK